MGKTIEWSDCQTKKPSCGAFFCLDAINYIGLGQKNVKFLRFLPKYFHFCRPCHAILFCLSRFTALPHCLDNSKNDSGK